MPMTQPTDASVDAFLAAVSDERRRTDSQAVCALIGEVTGAQPRMWGASMVGFGLASYTTADGKSHDWFAIGLAPRKAALTLYGLTFYGSNTDLLDHLGPYTTGKGCLYIKRLDTVDHDVLRALITRSWEATHQR